MALNLDTRCSSCNYSCTASVGGTRRTAGTSFHFPYGCRSCREVVNVQHVGVELLKCPGCGSSDLESFNTPALWKAGRGRFVEEGYCESLDLEFKLAGNGVPYPCPRCGERALTFEPVARFC